MPLHMRKASLPGGLRADGEARSPPAKARTAPSSFRRRASGNHPRHLGRRLQASRITGPRTAPARPHPHRGVRHGPQPPVPGYRPRRALREMRLGARWRSERARRRPNPPLRHQRSSAIRGRECSRIPPPSVANRDRNGPERTGRRRARASARSRVPPLK